MGGPTEWEGSGSEQGHHLKGMQGQTGVGVSCKDENVVFDKAKQTCRQSLEQVMGLSLRSLTALPASHFPAPPVTFGEQACPHGLAFPPSRTK